MTTPPTGLRVSRYLPRPGGVIYTWDHHLEETPATIYTIYRGDVVVRRTPGVPPTSFNGNDALLLYGKVYEVSLSVSILGDHSDESERCQPITVSLPEPATPVHGGEILYIAISFTDEIHPVLTTQQEQDFRDGCAWVNALSGGKMTWTPSGPIYFTLAGKHADYNPYVFSPTYVDMVKIRAEVVAALGLKERAGLWRVVLDMPVGLAYDSGNQMWPGADDMNSPTYGNGVWCVQQNTNGLVHEIFHTIGLWHYGAMNKNFAYAPAPYPDISDFTGYSIAYVSNEIMGSAAGTRSLSLGNMICLGIRSVQQLAPCVSGSTVRISRNEVTDGSTQGVYIPLGPSGAFYFIEYRAPYVTAVLWPAHGEQSMSFLQCGFGMGSGRVLTDVARGITVDIVSMDADHATIKVTTPVLAPVPDPIPAPTPTPTPPPMKQKPHRGRG